MTSALLEPPATSTLAEPQCAPACGVTCRTLMTVAAFCLLFLYHNYLPLFHSDLWGHVAYGEWILSHGRLPAEDPFAELAVGMPVVDNAWLAQVLLALAGRGATPEGLAHLFAVVVVATSLFVAAAAYVRTKSWGLSVALAGLALAIAWSRHAVQRPEIFGQLCFAGLLWLTARDGLLEVHRRPRTSRWTAPFAVPLLFAAWANLHGSFIVGYVLLGAIVVGQAIDCSLRTRSMFAVVCDPTVQRGLTLLELAVLGACLNPYGVDLVIQTLTFPTHPNLQAVLEWFPLQMMSLEGLPMAASWVLTAAVLRGSRRRLTATEVVLLLAFSAAVCLRVRMIAWYAPVCAVALAPHMADVLDRCLPRRPWNWWQRRSHVQTALTGVCVWLTFALAPISRPVLGGPPRPATQIYSHETPLGATRWLRQQPPSGLTFAPQWWGDWLAGRGPHTMRVMATTNAIHLLPRRVWQDYLIISAAETGWQDRLDRYRINTVLVSRELQPQLLTALEQSADWTLVYEDDVAAIAERVSLRKSRAAPQTVAETTP